MAHSLPDKVIKQIANAGLPTAGQVPFEPKLAKNKRGEEIIVKGEITKGPKKGKRGYLDVQDRIWIKDRAHGDVPDHWDVQENGGSTYFRIDMKGNRL